MPTYCCIESCWKNSESKHRFPNPAKDIILFNKWIKLCGNRRLVNELSPVQVYNSHRVCSLHFLPQDFGPNQKLKKGVLPSVRLPEPLILAEESQSSTSPVIIETINTASVSSTPTTSLHKLLISPTESSNDVCQKEILAIEQPNDNAILSMPKDNAIPSTSKQCASVSISSTSKKRSSLLDEVDVSQVKDLTPKAKHLFKRALQFRRKALLSNKIKLSLRKRLFEAKKVTETKMFEKAMSSMDRIRARFFECQLENANKKPKGRRYTLEDKVLAFALYKQSGAGYRFLSKLFALPSRKTVMKLLNRIPIRPGLHNEVFTILKAEVKNFKNPLDKNCILMFDEVSIQANLQVNLQEGSVEGFEDFGFKQSEEIANHSQVFMIRGIRRKWKQPVYYNFVNGGTKKDDLVNIIKIIIRKCQSIGLKVIATVCDQGSNNQAALNTLVKQTEETYKRKGEDYYEFCFEINGEKIIPLYDVPHLFKGLRNNLLKYKLHFVDDSKGKLAEWDHIFTAYKMDPYLGSLRLMPKITDTHVNPEKINKMKVSRCTQVFSHTVAAAINVFAYSGMTVETEDEVLTLDKKAADTADLLEFIDKLFDSLNGSSFQVNPGKELRSAVKKGTPHLKFWNEAIKKLGSFNFIKNGTFFTPPSLKNLIKTIKNFKLLWEELNKMGFTNLMPRTFNQDPLENFFGKIRQRGHRNINPTPTDFTHYYKSLMVNQLTSKQSVGANCEDDKSEVFLTLQRLVSQGLPEEEEENFTFEGYCRIPVNLAPSEKPIEIKALKYVSGYLSKKIRKECSTCKDFFFKRIGSEDFENEEFIKFKEYYSNRTCLKYISSSFLNKMKYALAIIKYIFNRNLPKRNIIKFTVETLCKKISFTTCSHSEKIKKCIFTYFVKINIFNYCRQLNRVLRGLDQRVVPQNAPKIFLIAKKMHTKTIKRKAKK